MLTPGTRVRVTGTSMGYLSPELQPGATGVVARDLGKAERPHRGIKKGDSLVGVVLDPATGRPESFRWPFPIYDLEVIA